MDFFGAQDRARRLSGWLVGLFGLAVVLIIVIVYLALAVALGPEASVSWWDAELFLMTAAGVCLVVAGASAFRTSSLRSGGGRGVAEMLGGREVTPDAGELEDRRLYNVVEEMALAAGMPVPSVFVLEGEQRINAFAAGYSPEDAVVAVTRGAVDAFTRDELQAVVAHEFSHILNRDIRLNIRLTGILFGILALGLGGRILLRTAIYSRGGRRDGRAMAALVAAGLAMFLAGYLGVFFGRIIRAAVSRQREHLADAAAVQFTRHPDGLASALKKIGAAGSRLESANAEEVSHFFFANGLRSGPVSNLWSTHPPLLERIRKLDPEFDGDFSRISATREREQEPPRPDGASGGERRLDMFKGAVLAGGLATASQRAAPLAGGDGDGDEHAPAPVDHLALDVPPVLRDAARHAFSAVALVYALILDREPDGRQQQLEILDAELAAPLREEVERLRPTVDTVDSETRLALVDMAAPALSGLSTQQAERLSSLLERVARADNRLSIFEFALKTCVRHRLAATHGRPEGDGVPLTRLADDARVVIAALAHAGSNVPAEARSAYQAGLRVLGDEAGTILGGCTSDEVRDALERLANGRLEARQRVLQACAATANHDRVVTPDEILLLRAIAAALDLAVPAGPVPQPRT
jgi:Zn-dependent protease with chaperone function